jgi:hypothetical protein
LCSTGFYVAGCIGAQSGVCTECSKCNDAKYAAGCGSISPGTCQNASSVSGSQGSEYSARDLAGLIIGSAIILLMLVRLYFFIKTYLKMRRQRAEEYSEAILMRGLACVQLVNRTPGMVQVNPPSRAADDFDTPSPPILSQLISPDRGRWDTCKTARSIPWGCSLR